VTSSRVSVRPGEGHRRPVSTSGTSKGPETGRCQRGAIRALYPGGAGGIPAKVRTRPGFLASVATAFAVAILASATARADGIDDLNASWVGRALRAQRRIDLDTPISDTSLVGAHNSFNSEAYASGIRYLDPNQRHSTFDQLRMGARAIEFDVHWTTKRDGLSFSNRLLLCHGTASHLGCGLDDRTFEEGLDEIVAWLGTADSIGQVLILHVEDHVEGRHGEAFARVAERLGDRIWASGGCSDIPANLTKSQVLAAGKQVIVWNEGGCSGDGNWNSMVFTGLGSITRVWEDSTTLGGGSVPPIGSGEIASLHASGINLVDLDQLDPGDGRWAAAVWSWAAGEPNDLGGEDCAAQQADGRWNDVDCRLEKAFACENLATGGWAVTSEQGSFGRGALACRRLGPDFRFAVPTNAQDNQLLAAARAAAGRSSAWLAHDDRDVEGDWRIRSGDDLFWDRGGLVLDAGASVRGASRMLRMEPNCNLVLYSLDGDEVGRGLWTSGTANLGVNCRAEFGSDGILAVRDGAGRALWNSGAGGTELVLQSDGNLVLYDDGRVARWSTFTNAGDEATFEAGRFTLTPGQRVGTRSLELALTVDGNLVVSSVDNGFVGGVLWRSGTTGPGGRAEFQSDGNLVVYDGAGRALWAAGTSGTANATLRLQSDGNVAIYNGAGEPLWSTMTNTPAQAVLRAGQFALDRGDWVQTRSRKLELTATCDLVLSSVDNAVVGGALWRSGTSASSCRADFQADGNFVLYDGEGHALWAAGTSGTANAELRIQPDGNVVVYNGAGEPLWTTQTRLPTESSFLAGRFALTPGQFVLQANRFLELRDDCQLVLHSLVNGARGLRVWDSNTAGAGTNCRLDFQSDGNLVLYDGSGRSLWAAGTSGTTGAVFRIQSDGNMVIYNGAGEPLWTSQTPGNFSEVAVCGDATCNGSEACGSCASDCGACPPSCDCGDGVVEPSCGEQCDDAAAPGGCCSADCRIEPAGTACRAAAGDCDVAEACDGTSATCPQDRVAGAGFPCRPADGACDLVESCDGASTACPQDRVAGAGVACRPAQDACDAAENCDGSGKGCPADAPAPDGTPCDDGQACTILDACSGGSCGGDPITCGDGSLQAACGEQCDDGGREPGDGCDASCRVEICPASPRTDCVEAARVKFQFLERSAGREQMKVEWKGFSDDTTAAGFGDPVSGANSVALCLYGDAGELVQRLEVDRGGERCAGAPCWQGLGSSGFRYKDGSASASGVQQLDFVAGDAGRGKASAKGRNDAGKGMTSLPTGVAFRLYGESHPTLQLATEHGFCLSAKVTTILLADKKQYKAERR